MTIRMYNAEVETVAEYLLGLSLKGKESRMRTRFIKKLQEQMDTIKAEHLEILKEYSNLNENGEPNVIENDEGQQVYDIKDLDAFTKEYNDLISEAFVIEVTEANKDVIKSVRKSVWNDEKEYSGQDALFYDRICEIIEGEE